MGDRTIKIAPSGDVKKVVNRSTFITMLIILIVIIIIGIVVVVWFFYQYSQASSVDANNICPTHS